MNKQLDLTAQELIDLGFEQNINNLDVCYIKRTINGYFKFNPLQKEYSWYHVTIIGESANHLHLDIKEVEDLELTLAVFRIIKKIER